MGFEEYWDKLEAFDSNGNSHFISVQKEPDHPVVVVGLNERSDTNGDILSRYLNARENISSMTLKSLENPEGDLPIPTSLNASSSLCYQIDLSWSYPTGTSITAFNIYRKKYGESNFSFLVSVMPNERIHYDINVDENTTYYYYITAEDLEGETDPSNQDYATTTTCLQPTDPDNLKIEYLNTNHIDLRWDNVSNETGYQIWQRIWDNGVLDSWQQIATTGVNQTEYEISNFQYDKQYYYKVYAYNEFATSAPTDHVIVYSSNRNITHSEVVGHCWFKDNAALSVYESWVYGRPEMMVKIVTINSTTGNAIEIVGSHGFVPSCRACIVLPSMYNWNYSMFKWDVRTHPISLTWVWYEVDPNDTEVTLNLGVGGEKPGTGRKINASVGVKMTKHDDPIFNQIVNWHDEFPKVYDNGLFYFILDNK